MKPKAQTEHEDGLLEYLEDIIGTSMYKQPIEDALVEVDNFNEARGEKITRLSIVAKEKSSLEARKREAETYLGAKCIRVCSHARQILLADCKLLVEFSLFLDESCVLGTLG